MNFSEEQLDQLREASDKRRKRLIWNFLIILAIFIGFSVYQNHVQSEADILWQQNLVSVTQPDGISWSVPYAQIQTAALEKCSDFGTTVSGGTSSVYRYGSWQNEQWGNYTTCSAKKNALCIVFYTESDIFVISYESNETTEALFDSILGYLPETTIIDR